jgi:hypothetical protein
LPIGTFAKLYSFIFILLLNAVLKLPALLTLRGKEGREVSDGGLDTRELILAMLAGGGGGGGGDTGADAGEPVKITSFALGDPRVNILLTSDLSRSHNPPPPFILRVRRLRVFPIFIIITKKIYRI